MTHLSTTPTYGVPSSTKVMKPPLVAQDRWDHRPGRVGRDPGPRLRGVLVGSLRVPGQSQRTLSRPWWDFRVPVPGGSFRVGPGVG